MDDDTTQPTQPTGQRSVASELGSRYELGGVIGKGGMGEVRLARDIKIHRDVAVKLMHGGERSELDLDRFFREARVQGVLEHPAIVPVHDIGIDSDGNPYFVMKRLAGVTLHDVIASKDADVKSRWPRRQLLARLVDICLAVEFAHARGVIHRDLKPANIMLGDYGEAYVLDWGLARLSADDDSFHGVRPLSGDAGGETVVGDLLGTPGYMSPEQARGEQVDPATDVFALGMVLYEILAGTPALPRGEAAIAETLSTSHHRPSARGDVPLELDDLCARATAADRQKRLTARELAEGVQSYLDGDRDIARRRELAEKHARAAQETLADGRLLADDARANAMRDAGIALALDPENQRAQAVLAALLLKAPDVIPDAARAAADHERGVVRQKSLRVGTLTYMLNNAIIVIACFLPLRHVWPVVFGLTVNLGTGLFAWMLARKPMPMQSPWFIGFILIRCATISSIGLLYGTLLLVPMYMISSTSAFLAQPSHHRPITIIALHAIPILLLLVLEQVGVLPPSFYVVNGDLIITPYTLDLTPSALILVLSVGFLVPVVGTAILQTGFRREQEKAQDRIHAQTWHLQRLLPRAGKLDP